MTTTGSRIASAFLLALAPVPLALAQVEIPAPNFTPLVRTIDLEVGESSTLSLCNGATATVELLDLRETHDAFQNAVRRAEVDVKVNGETTTLVAASYRLPVTVAGVQIDCAITRGYNETTQRPSWDLEKAARLRLWPEGSPLVRPGTFLYPLKQKWFAAQTQMCNVPTFVDGGEVPTRKSIYYHSGLDFGGTEAMVEVIAATDGIVVMAREEAIPPYDKSPFGTRYDALGILDARGWYYRYSHLYEIDEAIRPGAKVKMGQRIGLLGKEGASGGWSHLHFEIKELRPTGNWATMQAYAFAWEAYLREYRPPVIAVARPHILTPVGQTVALDATRSWTADGKPFRVEWTLQDGTTATGPLHQTRYDRPGQFSEIAKVIDGNGNFAYDFQTVEVQDPAAPDKLPPTIHPVYWPTFDLKPGQEITFKVRSFRTTHGRETWDFGDGSPQVTVQSDGNVKALAKDGYAITTHAYDRPGDYLISVWRENEHGARATGRLHVHIEE